MLVDGKRLVTGVMDDRVCLGLWDGLQFKPLSIEEWSELQSVMGLPIGRHTPVEPHVPGSTMFVIKETPNKTLDMKGVNVDD